jgi:sec-independent protein translocase protein TatA
MGSLSPTHWLVIAGLFLVLFGAKRLPDAARSLGRSLRIFKTEVQELQAGETEPRPVSDGPAASDM